MKTSIVVPVYNEEKNLPELLRRLAAVMDAAGNPYELVFVDDGSRDDSLAVLKEAAAARPDRVRVLELARNFGQHQAILAAFENVSGDVVVTLDADLQNPPEEIPKLLAKIAEGYDVVGGVRQNRQDSFLRRAASALVNRVTVTITRMRITDFGCMLRAYSRDVIEEINRCDESSTFIPALAQSFARRPTEIQVAHAPRRHGESAYSLLPPDPAQLRPDDRVLARALQVFGLLGTLVAFGGYLLRPLSLRPASDLGAEVEGVFTLFAILFTLLGIAMAGLGMVGEYVGRIYQQVRGRPRFRVRRVYGLGAGEARDSASRTPRPGSRTP